MNATTLVAMLVVLLCTATSAAADPGRKLMAPTPSASAPPTVQVVDIAPFRKLWQDNLNGPGRLNVTFLDVRPKTLFPLGHVPGARNVPYATAKKIASQFANKKRRVDPVKNVACYSTDTQSAVTACGQFAAVKAYAKVRFFALDGGIAKWVAAKYPVATGKKSQ